MKKPFFLRGAASLFVVSSAFGCSSLLGIENPSDDGTGGQGGDKPSSGGKSGSAGGNSPGSGGVTSGGTSDGPTGGRTNGGASSGGLGGADPSTGGSSGGASSTTVRGRIVDLFGRPMTGVEVRITGAEPAVTNSQGKFETLDAPASYDLEFRFTTRDDYYQTVYRFVGLTRRDPLLQVEQAVGDKWAWIEVIPTNLPAPAVGELKGSLGNPIDYAFAWDQDGTDGSSTSIDYDGTDPFKVPFHALFWKNDLGSSLYYGYASQDVLLNNDATTDVHLDTWNPVSETGHFAGYVNTPDSLPDVQVRPFLNFADGASLGLQITPWNSADRSFSVMAPSLGEHETFSVAARATGSGGGYALAHVDGLTFALSTQGIELTIPEAPVLRSPLSDALDVDETTEFRWTQPKEGPCALFSLDSESWQRLLRVVTCDGKMTIPAEYFDGYLPSESDLYWRVQYHGPFENADEMTGPDGFHDAFYEGPWAGGYPRGKNRPVSGTFAMSDTWHAVAK